MLTGPGPAAVLAVSRCLGAKKFGVLVYKVNIFEADVPKALWLVADHSYALILHALQLGIDYSNPLRLAVDHSHVLQLAADYSYALVPHALVSLFGYGYSEDTEICYVMSPHLTHVSIEVGGLIRGCCFITTQENIHFVWKF